MMWRRTLKVGARGEDVRTVQELLQKAGFDPGPIDGVFGRRTESATMNFQRSKGLDTDGVVGPKTWAALTASPTTNGPVKGLSLHIGLNRVDDNAYGMAVPALRGCENDARDMLALARAQQFEASQLLLTPDATVANVTRAISDAASTLKAGDFFFVTYSGHGSQMRDATGDEPDGQDETWVCYDRQLLDDELYALWGRFQPGVRIVVLSDSCHSGTVTRDVVLAYQALASSYHDSKEVGFVLETPSPMPLVATRDMASMSLLRESVREVMPGVLQRLYAGTSVAVAETDIDEHVSLVLRQLEAENTRGMVLQESPVTRNLPAQVAWFDFDRRRNTYRDAKLGTREARPPTASVLLISGCQDNQLSLDGTKNGLFTQRLLEVWDQGRFHGIGYRDMHRQIVSLMPPQQTPNLFWATPQDVVLEQQRPFTVQVS